MGAALKGGDSEGRSYESQTMVEQYLNLHFASLADITKGPGNAPGLAEALGTDVCAKLANFPRRCAQQAVRVYSAHGQSSAATPTATSGKRALDIGCAVGAACFELANTFEEVLGVDLSQAFVDAANTIKMSGECKYSNQVEGDIAEDARAVVPETPNVRERCTFQQMDACAMATDMGSFDLVLLCNLICRVPDPEKCLQRMGGDQGLVRPGGVLFITTPFTWLESCTPRSSWLGGLSTASHSEQYSLDGLRVVLEAAGFELLEQTAMPMIMREHARKFQLIVPTATAWRRVR